MTIVSFPESTTVITGAVTNVSNEPQRILVASQKTAAGTAASGALNINIQDDADTLAGITSMGAAVVRAIRRANTDTAVDAIFLDDASGTPATGSIVYVGTATAAGELTAIVGSQRNNKLSIAVAIGDTATAIGDALVAAITANLRAPVTGVNTAGSVVLTAENDGTEGNGIHLEVGNTVAGITQTVTAMTGGATDPTLTGIFDVIGDTRYQAIVWSWSNSLAELITLVDDRFNVTDDIQDGLGHVAASDTLSNHLAVAAAENTFINYHGQKLISTANIKGNDRGDLPYVLAGYAGALRSVKLTVGAAIADLNVGESGLDGIGGPALASRPLANTPVNALIPSTPGIGWTKLEIKQLNDAGISVMGNNRAGNTVVLGQQMTLRTTDVAGNPDDSFKTVNNFDTATGIREFYDSNLRSSFGQTRLYAGDLVAGRPGVNKILFEAKLTELFTILSEAGFVLTQAGQAALNFFIASMVVIPNFQTGTIAWSVKTPINVQLRTINGVIQIVFDVVESSGVTETEEA